MPAPGWWPTRPPGRGFVRYRLPSLGPDPVAEATCLCTGTPDEDFVLDRHGPFVIVSPCSGRGAKFTPLIGALAADLATGRTEPEPRFRLERGQQRGDRSRIPPRGRPLDVRPGPIDTPVGNPSEQVGKHGAP